MAGRLRKHERCDCGECRKCLKRAYDRERYVEHREETLNRTTRWYSENRERKAAYDAARRTELADEILDEKRAYYEANRERMLRQMRERYEQPEVREAAKRRAVEWRVRNPEAFRRYVMRANHRRRGAPHHDHDDTLYAREVLLRDPCSYCDAPAEHVDHIVPISRGGTSHWSNLTAACGSCNSSKHANPLLVFLART